MLVGIFQYFFEVPRYFRKIKSGHTDDSCYMSEEEEKVKI